MQHVEFTANIDLDPWADLQEAGDNIIMYSVERFGVLPNGTESGKATVAFVMRPRGGGDPIIAETTLAMFLSLAAAAKGTPTAQMEDM